jgi:zinc transport system substrate-binding protein
MVLVVLPINQFFRFSLLLFILCFGTAQAAAAPMVVVSISPLQALVSEVMQGVAQPTLLLYSSQSPHHASLRPSQLRALNRAKLVFWIGPQMETFLPGVLSELGPDTKTVALMANPKLHTLPRRNIHNATEHGEHLALDPHIWLSSYNAGIMVNEIAAQLSKLDPEHRAVYLSNAHRMQLKIRTLHKQLASRLEPGARYISYHDAFQYFEKEFGLHHLGSVSQHDELQPSAKHVRELRQLIRQQDVHCIVYDAPIRPTLIDTLLQGSNARAVELDGLGLLQPNDQRNWFVLMQHLADNFAQCLGPQTAKK